MTLIRQTDSDFARVLARRFALMQARNQAVARRDWAEMDAITIKLAKLPTPTASKVQA